MLAVCGESRTYGFEGGFVSVFIFILLCTYPICSMIYGSTGATHFDQLAKIMTGYELTSLSSSGLFMGILFIAVGFLFKITAVPFRAALFVTASCTFSVIFGGTVTDLSATLCNVYWPCQA